MHYVLPSGRESNPSASHGAGTHRPATVVHVWPDGTVNLQVLTDGVNDGEQWAAGLVWRTSVHEDQDGKAPGTWHWPERVV